MRTSSCESIRKNIFSFSYFAQSAHVGSSLSVVEILYSLFSYKKNVEQGKSAVEIVLSKGHAAMALYATAIEFGLLEMDVIQKYLKDNSELWGHPSINSKFPFIAWSTGSLGHALPVFVGKSYSAKYLKANNKQFFVVLSDGELNEGSNWEAFMFAGHHKLSNLTILIDYNKIQSLDRCSDVMDLEPLADKFKAFGLDVYSVNGHNVDEISEALNSQPVKPRVVICHTVKAKGYTELEDTVLSHYRPVSAEVYNKYVLGEK